MYSGSNFLGCLISIIILVIIFAIIKEFWWLIVGIILISIVAYYAKMIYETIKEQNIKKKTEYNPQMGEVYKVCPFCNTKVKVTETTCPNCKHALN